MFHDKEAFRDGPLYVASTRYGDDVVVVSLSGELDRSNVAGAERLILDQAEEGDDLLVIDLSGLEFIDSSGVAMLVAANEIRRESGSLRIVPSGYLAVTQILRLTGVDSMIESAWERPGPSRSPSI